MNKNNLIQSLIQKIPEKYNYTIHNLIAHPLMEVFHVLGYTDLGNKIHEITLPSRESSETLE